MTDWQKLLQQGELWFLPVHLATCPRPSLLWAKIVDKKLWLIYGDLWIEGIKKSGDEFSTVL